MKTLLTSIICLLCLGAYAQDTTKQVNDGRLLSATVDQEGDTVAYVYMNTYYVWGRRNFKSKKEKKKYNRLEHNVKTVYPYAKKANELLMKYQSQMTEESSEREIKKFYKQIEKELWAEYGEELENLTMTQGRILIKLVDRETDHTSYELVKELRSGFTAFVFQGMARLFGHNLKSEYDAAGEDKFIEEIVLAIESNQTGS